MSARLPDFLIIGAMKSGTTSLYRWLGDQPDVWLPGVKEPAFFARDDRWERGLGWYGRLFEPAPPDARIGEASVAYTHPQLGPTAAERIAGLIPSVRLVYLVRDPIARLRSHYRHQVQRGRERRPLREALADEHSPYVGTSLYHRCLLPYLVRFGEDQVLVVRSEDLLHGGGWERILRHLGLEDRPAPGTTHNVTAEKAGYSPGARWLWELGLLDRLGRIPAPVRAVGRRLLLREGGRYRELLESSTDPVPSAVSDLIRQDVARLEDRLGVGRLWPPGRHQGVQE